MNPLVKGLTTIAIATAICPCVNAQQTPVEPQAELKPAPKRPSLSEEFSKQLQIFQTKGEAVPEGFVVDRGLLAYSFALSSEFDRGLAALGPGDRWLDIGAGQGQAILDYYGERFDAMHPQGREQRGKKAQAVGISIGDRRTEAWHQTAAKLDKNQIQYFAGKPLREYSREVLGRFQLISDVIGGFSYTEYLSQFMQKVLDLLTVNGSFHSLLMDVHYEKIANRPYYPGAAYRTEIVNARGEEVKLCSWLKQISCVEVMCEAKTDWAPPIEVYQVRKVCDDITVPPLSLVHFEAGTPPERRYRLGDALPAKPAK